VKFSFLQNRTYVLAAATVFAAASAVAQTPARQQEQQQPQAQQQQQREQAHRQQQPGPQYDRQAETTVRGTVQNVSRQNQEKMGRGTHVTLRAEDGSTHNVYLGPQDYLQRQRLQVRRNDKLEVTGSRATVNGRQVLLAREVTKDNRTVALRTDEGMPHWQAADRMAPGAADRMSPDELYDRKAEATIRGTVEDLRVFARPGMSAKQHAIVRTQDGQEITVQLGPPDFMNQQAFRLSKGDEVEITGARVKFGADESILAREVRREDRVFTLRSAEGRPQWREPGRAGQQQQQQPQQP
jgi:hypothetical protein